MKKKFLCLVKLVIGLTFLLGPPLAAFGEQLFIVGLPPGVTIPIPELLRATSANTFPETPSP
jgi:hypothetical protein